MIAEPLPDIVRNLSTQEQDAVRRFIEHLKGAVVAEQRSLTFLEAADEFVFAHPEILRRLAQ